MASPIEPGSQHPGAVRHRWSEAKAHQLREFGKSLALQHMVLFSILMVVWHVSVRNGLLPGITFSTPLEVGRQLLEFLSGSETIGHVGVTLTEAAVGFALGVGLAVIVMTAFITWPLLESALTPVIVVMNAVPRMALAPLFIVWFGIGLTSKFVLVATVVFFIVFINLQEGLAATDRVKLANLRVLGASRKDLLIHYYWPSLFGWLIAGLRTSVGFAFAAAIVAEYLGSTKGLGFVIFWGLSRYQPAETIAGIILMLLVVLPLMLLVDVAQNKMQRWRVTL